MGQKIKSVCLDSNIFNYHLNQHKKFGPKAKIIFDLLSDRKLKATTSIITLIELLSAKVEPTKLKNFRELILNVPNLTIVDVTQKIGIEAARIRREYNLRTPDAIQLATTKISKADAFVTNDKKLKAFKQARVLLINQITFNSFSQ